MTAKERESARASAGEGGRERDREMFSDAGFNRWLDEYVSDTGHTVYDYIGGHEMIAAAWGGWDAYRYYHSHAPQPAQAGASGGGVSKRNPAFVGEWHARAVALGYDGVADMLDSVERGEPPLHVAEVMARAANTTPAPISVERLPEKWRRPPTKAGVEWIEANARRQCAYELEQALPALLQQLAEREADLEREQGVREDAQRQLRVALNDLHDMRWMYAQELKRATAAERAREEVQRRYEWAANELLACDYGDNDRNEIGWRVYGWRSLKGRELRIYGPSIDDAIAAFLAASGGSNG